MANPSDRKYLESHEWHKLDGDVATIGITQTAADELTDITFISLPKVGDKLEAGKRFGEVESVKATSDLYSGVTGTVSEINTQLIADPGTINRDPFNAGWMLKVKVTNPAEMTKLLSAEEYEKKTGH